MDIRNKFMFRVILGTTLGLIVGIVMYALSVPEGTPFDKSFFVCHFIGSTIIGLVGYGGAIVYDIESWSLGRATFTHYIICFMTLFVLSELLGWFPRELFLYVFLGFSLVYLIIWLAEYLIWKRKIGEMNEELDVMLKSDNLKKTE